MMKKHFSLFLFFAIVASANVFAQPYYLRGEAVPCDWGNSATGCELTDPDGNGTFELTLDLGAAPGIGFKEFKVYSGATDSWAPAYANAWYRHKGGSVIFRFRPSTGQVEVKDAVITAICAPGAFSDWNNTTAMVKAANVYCYTIATPGTYEWKPTYCGEWKSWQPCDGLGERSTNSGNWSVTTTVPNEQVCITYNPTTGKVTPNSKLVLSNTKVNLLCNGAGGTGSINLTVAGAEGPFTYAWSNEATTEDLTALTPGTYTVTVSKAGYCNATRSVVITEPTAVAFTHSTAATSATKFKVTLMGSGGTIYSATAPYRYRRSSGTTFTAWSVNPVFLNLSAGTYTFEMRDKNGCTTSQTFLVSSSNLMIAPETAEQSVPEASIEIAPNPASDFVNVRISGIENITGTITVTDVLGRKLLEQTATPSDDATIQISVATLQAGSYCLYFRGADGTLLNKCFVVGL